MATKIIDVNRPFLAHSCPDVCDGTSAAGESRDPLVYRLNLA
jgi:hypothetical protein